MYFEMFYRENFCNLHIIVGNALSWDNTKVFLVHTDESVHIYYYIYVAMRVRALVAIFSFFFSAFIRLLKFYTFTAFTHRKFNLQFIESFSFALQIFFPHFPFMWKFYYTFTFLCTVCAVYIDAIVHFTVFIQHTLLLANTQMPKLSGDFFFLLFFFCFTMKKKRKECLFILRNFRAL